MKITPKGGIDLNQSMGSSYEDWRPVLEKVQAQLVRQIPQYNQKEMEEHKENDVTPKS